MIACEYSGAVRDAFIARGHEAMSCDLLPTERPSPHYQGDVRDVIGDGWDLMIAHPPCTHLAVSGARWFAEKQTEQAAALEFVRWLLAAKPKCIGCHQAPTGGRSAAEPMPELQRRWLNSGNDPPWCASARGVAGAFQPRYLCLGSCQ